jgi:hypothetical protein
MLQKEIEIGSEVEVTRPRQTASRFGISAEDGILGTAELRPS